MSNNEEVLKSAKDIVSNMEDLVNDIANLDEHEHDADDCRDCQTIREEADENHDHDVWNCSNCEELVDTAFSEKVDNLDVNDLMDYNYNLWQTVGEEAVVEYQERTGSTIKAISELARLVNELYDSVESTDDDDVASAITFLIENVYGVREEPKPDIIEEITTELPSVTTKCSCGADHSIVDYTNKED